VISVKLDKSKEVIAPVG